MRHIATNRHVKPMQASFVTTNGQRIQQCLCRMFMASIPGIEDRTIDLFRKQLDRTAITMAHDKCVRVHRVKGHRRINQGFTLFDRTGPDSHIDDHRAQSFGRQFK